MPDQKRSPEPKEHRLFIAADLPLPLHNHLTRVQERVRGLCRKLSVTPADNLHLTLKFIGEVDTAKRDEIIGLVQTLDLTTFGPLTVEQDRYGSFTSREKENLIWAGLSPSPGLIALVDQIQDELSTLGIPRDQKRWLPHITLARRAVLKDKSCDLSGLPLIRGTRPVPTISLYLSERTAKGMRYTPLVRLQVGRG